MAIVYIDPNVSAAPVLAQVCEILSNLRDFA
jgi:hypothetical protein